MSYGYGFYGSDGYKGSTTVAEPLHYYALKKINPLPQVTGVMEDDQTIEGKFLDDCFYSAGGAKPLNPGYPPDQSLLAEVYPDTAFNLLPSWNRIYNLPSTGSFLDQRNAVIAAVRSKGGLSRAYFTTIAGALGYVVSITENTALPFFVGVTQLPHALLDIYAQWTWQVSTYHTTPTRDAQLEAIFQRLKPAHTVCVFTYY